MSRPDGISLKKKKFFMMTRLVDVLHRVAHSSDLNLEAQALALGRHRSTYSNAVNRNISDDRRPNFPAEDLVKFCQMHETTAPLDHMESELGRVSFWLPNVPDCHNTIQVEMNRLVKEFGDVLQKLGQSMEPNSEGGITITHDELLAIEVEVSEMTPQLYVLLKAISQQVKGHSQS